MVLANQARRDPIWRRDERIEPRAPHRSRPAGAFRASALKRPGAPKRRPFAARLGLLFVALVGLGACSKKSEAPVAENEGARTAKPVPAPPAKPLTVPLPDVPKATAQQAELLEQTLRALVQKGAREDGFPWALAHGLLAFGPDLETDAGRPAVDAIASHFRSSSRSGRSVLRLPDKTPEGLPAEAHPDAALLAMVSSGVPLERELVVEGGRKVTLQQLVDDAEWVFSMPKTDRGWQQFAWSATLLMSQHEGRGEVTTAQGKLPVAELAEAALSRTEHEQAFLLPALRAGRPDDVEKRRQGIFAHTCGGLHLVQAGVRAGPSLGMAAVKRVREQLDVIAFRWVAERTLYRDKIREHPEYAPLLLVQELKFFGHILETLALAAERSPAVIEPRDTELYAKVTVDLARTVEQLKPIYAAHESLRKASAQTYYDLIGDGCHAVRGLTAGRAVFLAAKPTGVGSK